jgi:hypothetical protein
MITRRLRRSAVVIGTAVAAILLSMSVTSPAASATTMRTLNLSLYCSTGEAYGLTIDNGSGWYSPSGSSYVSGEIKYFTVSIPASATELEFMPLSCANQPAGSGPDWYYRPNTITAGTSTINANGSCQDYSYSYGFGQTALIFDCTLSSLTYA